MGWVILAAALLLPFVCAGRSNHPAGRIGLLLCWLASGGLSAYCFRGVSDLTRELQTLHRYELPASPGRHHVEIAPMPQQSMKGVLHGGPGVLPRGTLERFAWKFPEKVPVTWFTVKEHDEPTAGDTLLFYVDWPSAPPYRLEYEVLEGLTETLRPLVLVVTYDRSARHILEDGLAFIRILAWTSCLWASVWMVVQVAQERARRRKKNASGPAGTEAFRLFLGRMTSYFAAVT